VLAVSGVGSAACGARPKEFSGNYKGGLSCRPQASPLTIVLELICFPALPLPGLTRSLAGQ